MPSKKRKYNARFPAGRIKKIMQTDEEVGKVAQAVPIIIYSGTPIHVVITTPRTLELFVESLLRKALQVTSARNAKTLSPSHVKQCILAEARFDFLRDLVKNIPDVSAAEEKELLSAESSPNSSRFSDMSVARRVVQEDSNSSSSCDVKLPRDNKKQRDDAETDLPKRRISETATSTIVSADAAIDLSKKKDDQPRMANFYQDTFTEKVQHKSVIQVNPTYSCPQPSTSSYASLATVDPVQRMESPKQPPLFYLDVRQNNNVARVTPPKTPVTPLINIDFSKSIAYPEIKVLDTSVANIVDVKERKLHRQNSKVSKAELKKDKATSPPVDLDNMNSGNLQIDEDYDT